MMNSLPLAKQVCGQTLFFKFFKDTIQWDVSALGICRRFGWKAQIFTNDEARLSTAREDLAGSMTDHYPPLSEVYGDTIDIHFWKPCGWFYQCSNDKTLWKMIQCRCSTRLYTPLTYWWSMPVDDCSTQPAQFFLNSFAVQHPRRKSVPVLGLHLIKKML